MYDYTAAAAAAATGVCKINARSKTICNDSTPYHPKFEAEARTPQPSETWLSRTDATLRNLVVNGRRGTRTVCRKGGMLIGMAKDLFWYVLKLVLWFALLYKGWGPGRPSMLNPICASHQL